jgi:hypothetical protein
VAALERVKRDGNAAAKAKAGEALVKLRTSKESVMAGGPFGPRLLDSANPETDATLEPEPHSSPSANKHVESLRLLVFLHNKHVERDTLNRQETQAVKEALAISCRENVQLEAIIKGLKNKENGGALQELAHTKADKEMALKAMQSLQQAQAAVQKAVLESEGRLLSQSLLVPVEAMQQQQQAMQSLQAQLEAASAALADKRGVNEALQVRAGGVFVGFFFALKLLSALKICLP